MAGHQKELTLRFLAQPRDVNYGGKVFGGTVMGWIDQGAYALAAGWCGGYAVTAYVGGIRFEAPIAIGHMVEVHARMLHTGHSSMHIGVDVRARDPRDDAGQARRCCHCIVVFVAVDAQGRPQPVPAHTPANDQERELSAYAQRFMELRAGIDAARREYLERWD